MINWLKNLLKAGIPLPVAYDPVTKLPSVTLLFFYISYVISMGFTLISSSFLLIEKQYLLSTWMPAIHLFMMFICYRLRSLDKIKIDIDDRQIELDNNEGKVS